MDRPQLSTEDLRFKRLEHLGILHTPPGSPVTATTAAKPIKRPPPKVIDLLSDKDIEESYQELQRRKKQAKQMTASKANNRSLSTIATSQTEKSMGVPDQETFSVATWNVWFGPFGDGAPYANLRMKAIARILLTEENNLWCIGFQEVVNELYTPLSKCLQSKYVLFRQPTRDYGCALAVHRDLRILDHGWQAFSPTQQNRGILWVRFRGQKRTVLFCTTHLESYCGDTYTGAAERAQQVQQVDAFCDTMACDVVIFNGDMNWDDEKTARSKRALTDVRLTSLLPDAWTDTWLMSTKPPKDPGYTYDPKKNPMFNGGNLQRRFDRCLVKGSVGCTGPPKIVGQMALPDITFEKVQPLDQNVQGDAGGPERPFWKHLQAPIFRPNEVTVASHESNLREKPTRIHVQRLVIVSLYA